MNIITKTVFISLIALFGMALFSCDKDVSEGVEPEGSCYIILYDGDNFKDDKITINGPDEYPSLKNLPGSSKDWNDEADSFKAGKTATVTFWTETDFKGDSITFDPGTENPSIDEPSSMKIRCN